MVAAIDALDFPDGAGGYVVALGSRPAVIEVWSRPEPVVEMLRSLLRGLLIDLPDIQPGPPPRRGAVESFMADAQAARISELASTGAGRALALNHLRLHGNALTTDTGELLHLTAISRDFYDLAV